MRMRCQDESPNQCDEGDGGFEDEGEQGVP